jgi:restriction system protein
MNPDVFVVRADYRKYSHVFESEGYVAIGWFDEDPFDWDISNKEYIKLRYKEKYPLHPNMKMQQNVGQIYRFAYDMKIGDLVLCPSEGNQLNVGRVESELYFSEDSTSRFFWRRRIKWFKEKIDRHTLSVPLQNTLRASQTCFRVNPANEILERVGLSVNENETSNSNQTIAHNNSEIIRNRFLQLDATEFEYLVSYLLRTLGFEPSQEIGKVGDGGIDFEGVLDVSGIASINLQVQVKRFDKGVVGEREIRSFRGALKKGFQGCFITLSKFNKKAIESAVDAHREQIQLIDGSKFIDIFVEQYDRIMDALHDDDMDELAGKLKFKKSLLPI